MDKLIGEKGRLLNTDRLMNDVKISIVRYAYTHR